MPVWNGAAIGVEPCIREPGASVKTIVPERKRVDGFRNEQRMARPEKAPHSCAQIMRASRFASNNENCSLHYAGESQPQELQEYNLPRLPVKTPKLFRYATPSSGCGPRRLS